MRNAVLLTTYQWDAFVERQVDRLRALVDRADVFVIGDITRGTVYPAGSHIILTSEQELSGRLDLPLIQEVSGRGPMFWWNLDYLTYRFFSAHPEYDACLTLDFDASITIDIDAMFGRMHAENVALIAEPVVADFGSWYWTEPHGPYCGPDEIDGRLLCVMVITRSAAAFLERRRRDLGYAYRSGALKFWPFCEVFLPVELKRGGFRVRNLSDYGSTSAYGYRPLRWEGEAQASGSFSHPVLDTARFLTARIGEHHSLSDVIRSRSALAVDLRRFPTKTYAPYVWRELRRRMPRKLGLG